MGITLTAPPPYLSNDPILPFDAHAAMSEAVFTCAETPSLPSSIVPTNPNYNPAPLADTDKAAPWKALRQVWDQPIHTVSAGQNLMEVVATTWAAAFGWDAKALDGVGTPKLLIDGNGGNGGLEVEYMACPFIAAVG
jgi:hypothetical protein